MNNDNPRPFDSGRGRRRQIEIGQFFTVRSQVGNPFFDRDVGPRRSVADEQGQGEGQDKGARTRHDSLQGQGREGGT